MQAVKKIVICVGFAAAAPTAFADWSGVGGVVQNVISNNIASAGSQVLGVGGANKYLSPAAKNVIPQPSAATASPDNCQDVANRIEASKKNSLESRMPSQTPAQAMADNGVFDTLQTKVSFLGDLLGDSFGGFANGLFSKVSDGLMNTGANIAYNMIGINPKTGQVNYSTMINKVTGGSGISGAISGAVNSTAGNGIVGNVINNTVTPAINSSLNQAVNNANTSTSAVLREQINNPGSGW